MKYILVENVWKHLFNRGFMSQYFFWFQHGDGYGGNRTGGSCSDYQTVVDKPNTMHDHHPSIRLPS